MIFGPRYPGSRKREPRLADHTTASDPRWASRIARLVERLRQFLDGTPRLQCSHFVNLSQCRILFDALATRHVDKPLQSRRSSSPKIKPPHPTTGRDRRVPSRSVPCGGDPARRAWRQTVGSDIAPSRQPRPKSPTAPRRHSARIRLGGNVRRPDRLALRASADEFLSIFGRPCRDARRGRPGGASCPIIPFGFAPFLLGSSRATLLARLRTAAVASFHN